MTSLRIWLNDCNSIQYRMHPDISKVPSLLFYGSRLVDGPCMAEKTRQLWHKSALLGTYKLFNVAKGQEEQAQVGHSLINRVECDIALALYERFLREFRDIDMDFRIGIITMYRAQLLLLKRIFQTRHGATITSKIDFNTVDGFQGQEKDVIILSCVRAGPGVRQIGFLSDYRRLNVSITRARSSLFILGNAPTLERSDGKWKHIVQDARDRLCLLDVCLPSDAKLSPDNHFYRWTSTHSRISQQCRTIQARQGSSWRCQPPPSQLLYSQNYSLPRTLREEGLVSIDR